MPFLEIRDLSYTYPGTGIRAVDGLDLDAEKGEFIALIGPNAAGKSTFAKLLKRLLKPDEGRVTRDGRELAADGPDPGIGILFSSPENQLITSIVEEDVAFGLEVQCLPPVLIREKVAATLKGLGITRLRRRMPHLLSGGEQQMAALAGVLVMEPEILILDEPTTYLDPGARKAVLEVTRQLAEEGKVIFLITHNMVDAAGADRVIVMNDGRIAMDGSAEKVFSASGLVGRYGIHPPFLIGLAADLRSLGLSVDWPASCEDMAGVITDAAAPLPAAFETSPPPGHPRKERPPALAFEDIHYSYTASPQPFNRVLQGVDFSLDEGKAGFVCGANGSGKSTLLQLSNGLIAPDRGEVLLAGYGHSYWKRKPGGVPGRIGLVFQNPERQVFSTTVFDEIAFGPRNMGCSGKEIREKVLRSAGWVGLPASILDRPVLSLSGGQMRRLAVAGVLAMEPRVLVLDEPSDGLDPKAAREFYAGVRKYCDDTGTAVIVAAHAVPEQASWIDVAGHLEEGRMRSFGPSAEVLTGISRTLPDEYLPDHLILRQELRDMGFRIPDGLCDPEAVGTFLLDRVKANFTGIYQ